ncbi:hypothetical protein, partial [Achromobacter spanius]|uniref:hypothetical protein n=1 Tax=Achromobacter spanius TaxID=217203 RepID=UPI003F69359A
VGLICSIVAWLSASGRKPTSEIAGYRPEKDIKPAQAKIETTGKNSADQLATKFNVLLVIFCVG